VVKMVEERRIEVDGLPTRYLEMGEGPPLVLLHALGESASDWRRVLPALSGTRHVYAPDLPGFGDSGKPAADYSSAFFARFVAGYLDALGIGLAAVVGNSLGGLAALRLALSEPARVSALGLVDGAGLGREVAYALRLPTLPGYGELGIILSKAPPGAVQRAWLKTGLLFANRGRVPPEWFEEQRRLVQLPGFPEAALTALRAQVNLGGQREVLLDHLPQLGMSTLVVWGTHAGSSPSLRHERRSPVSGTGLSTSSRAAATCPKSSAPTALLPP
jgi:2-hydroxy-6-oxonona-2,4-dienedioate hydrolase